MLTERWPNLLLPSARSQLPKRLSHQMPLQPLVDLAHPTPLRQQ
jgi:hypothetical protein